jgi:hypothetical protein
MRDAACTRQTLLLAADMSALELLPHTALIGAGPCRAHVLCGTLACVGPAAAH